MPEKQGDDDKKIRVLWYSDFLKHTGFGNVAEEILTRLNATGKYSFEVIGINHHGEPYNSPKSDYFALRDIPVWPAMGPDGDMLGIGRLKRFIREREFDILFVLQDTFNMLPIKKDLAMAHREKSFRHIYYFPVDSDLKKDWVTDAVMVADHPVTYTKYGLRKVQEQAPLISIPYIYHGVDTEVFHPFKGGNKERNAYRLKKFGIDNETLLITNVNRNQPRKDLPRCILAFVEFRKRYPEIEKAKLYLHCHIHDSAGWSIAGFIDQYVPKRFQNDIFMADAMSFGPNGLPTEEVAKIYAASDIVTSTTLGEGWGLSTTEAMACATPVVMPGNTSTVEIIGENEERGYLAKSGGDPNLYTVMKFDNDIRRPLTDIGSLVEKWKEVWDNPEETGAKVDAAYLWVQGQTWDIIARKWDELFTKAYQEVEKERS